MFLSCLSFLIIIGKPNNEDDHQNVIKKHLPVESPLRSEMFSSEQMKQHGKMLAGLHQLTKERSSPSLLIRLTENEKILLETHALLSQR